MLPHLVTTLFGCCENYIHLFLTCCWLFPAISTSCKLLISQGHAPSWGGRCLKSSPCSVHPAVRPSRSLRLPGVVPLSNLLESTVRALSVQGPLHAAFWAAPSYAVSVVSSQFRSEERDSDCRPRLAFSPLGWPGAPPPPRNHTLGVQSVLPRWV